MYTFELLSLNEESKWKDFLLALPIEQQDIYFTPEYYALYEEYGDGKAHCFVFQKDGNLILYPFLKNSINALGYQLDNEYFDIQGAYGYNGIVSSSKDKNFINTFHACFEKYCIENNIIAEFTRFHPILNNYELSINNINVVLDRKTVALNVNQSYNDIWTKAYSSKNRNMIRKAHKLGYHANIIESTSIDDINQFIDIYSNSMQAVGAEQYYFFNQDFFKNMFEFLKGHIYLINIKDKIELVVCSSIFFHYYKYFHYHLSGRIQEADNSVNNFLLDEALKLAQKLGAELFHFGGGRTGSTDDSLLKFKENFSKTSFDFYIGKQIYNKKIYDKIVEQWEAKHPLSYAKNYVKLLGYREI